MRPNNREKKVSLKITHMISIQRFFLYLIKQSIVKFITNLLFMVQISNDASFSFGLCFLMFVGLWSEAKLLKIF